MKKYMTKLNFFLNKGTDLDITWEEFLGANNFSKVREVTKLSDYVMLQ